MPPALIPWKAIFTSGARADRRFSLTELGATNVPQRFHREVKV
jgi:hypothetical protein